MTGNRTLFNKEVCSNPKGVQQTIAFNLPSTSTVLIAMASEEREISQHIKFVSK